MKSQHKDCPQINSALGKNVQPLVNLPRCHWLETAWETSLTLNVVIDPKGDAAGGCQLTEFLPGASVLKGDLRSTPPWLPHHVTELS